MAGYELTTKILGVIKVDNRYIGPRKMADGYSVFFETGQGTGQLILDGDQLLQMTFKVIGKKIKGGVAAGELANSKLKGKKITIVVSD